MKQDTQDFSPSTPPAMETIGDRYAVVRELGRGSQGKLYLAEDGHTGAQVAIKELDLKLVDEWKAVELFDRETEALESLEHPGIPAYVDAFHQDAGDGAERFFLVQEYIEGRPLSERIDEAVLMDEAQARRFLGEMLSILDYMQSLNPPVVHRDIKPSNIIARPDGSHALVDFGAVQTVLPETVGGSTVVGTTGFMPPEQLMGRATPASDIYALGATIVSAMSGFDPADLEVVRMELQFQDRLEASDEWILLLERMLDPAVENRLQSASAVFDAMQDPSALDVPSAVPTGDGELVRWEPTAERIARLEDNPPRVPMSMIDASPERLIVEVGPVQPPPRNWLMPVILLAMAALLGAVTGGCCLVVTIPIAIALTVKGVGYLRPVSERLELNAEALVLEKIEHKRLGEPEVDSQSFEVDRLYLPHVHRITAKGYQSGKKHLAPREAPGGGESVLPGKPGLIFTTADGESVPFGLTIMTEHRLFQSASAHDDGELDWLADIISEYMRYVREGASDE